MELKSDTNGLFIEGMSDSSELADYIRRKFKEKDIQNTYENLTKGHIKIARSEGITPLRKFWQALNHSHKNTPTLKCEKVAHIAAIPVWQQHKLNGMAY